MYCLNRSGQIKDDHAWDDIIHNTDPGDIRKIFHLDYIFSEVQVCDENILKNKRLCIIAHMYYLDLMEHCMEYIERVPKEIDVFITTNEREKADRLEQLIAKLGRDNVKLIISKNRGREISALLVACKDKLSKYEYLCFVHDKKRNRNMPFGTVGQSFMDILWENSIKNEIYIKNVIAKFEEDPKLGFLTPPAPYMSTFFTVSARSWTSNFDITEKLAKRLGLNCVLNENKHPFALGTAFWCRTDALMPLFKVKLQYEDFEPEPMDVEHTISHGIERIFPYVAQSQGYYSGVMMSREYASIYLTNYQYMIGKIIDKYIKKLDIKDIAEIPTKSNKLFERCKAFKKVYVFGTGAEAGSCDSLFKESKMLIQAFIVSKGYKDKCNFRGKPVYEIDEIEPSDDELIIVALNAEHRSEVMPQLIKRGFKHIERYR